MVFCKYAVTKSYKTNYVMFGIRKYNPVILIQIKGEEFVDLKSLK